MRWMLSPWGLPILQQKEVSDTNKCVLKMPNSNGGILLKNNTNISDERERR